jgi:hypothetical protein
MGLKHQTDKSGKLRKSDENMPDVPMLIRDGSNSGFSQLYQEGTVDQQLPGRGCFGRFVRPVGAGLEHQTDKYRKLRKEGRRYICCPNTDKGW